MKETVAQALVKASESLRKMDHGEAAHIVALWLTQELGAVRNRWGKYEIGAALRWHISDRVVHKQTKGERSGDWFNARSYGLIDLALELIKIAEEKLGIAGGRGATMKASRGAAAEKAEAKREEKKLQDQALELANKALSFKYRDEALVVLQHKPLPEDRRAALAAEQKALRDEFVAALRAGTPPPATDEAFATVDKPPVLALYKDIKYQWVERQDGVEYTIRVEEFLPTRIHIGASASGMLQIDPVTHVMRSYMGPELKGDGHADGSIEPREDHEGRLHARLFMMAAHESKKGAGARMLKLWCRLMAGYGVTHWLGEAVGPEGMAFLKRMEARGAIKIEAEDRGYLVVRCL